MNDDTSFLDTLKPGDYVMVQYPSMGSSYRLGRESVERLTKTQIVLSDCNKYRRESGRQVGRHYEGPRIVEYSVENRKRYQRQERRAEFNRLVRNAGRSDDDLTDGEIAAMLDAYRKHRSES